MNKEHNFTQGLRFWDKHPNAPEWVIGKISIKPKEFTDWLKANYKKGEEYINIEVKRGNSGNPYTELSTFKPNQASQSYKDANNAPSQSSGGNSQQGQQNQNRYADWDADMIF